MSKQIRESSEATKQTEDSSNTKNEVHSNKHSATSCGSCKYCPEGDFVIPQKCLNTPMMVTPYDEKRCPLFIKKRNNNVQSDGDETLYTDMRNAHTLATLIKNKAHYNTTKKSWMVYNGAVWETDSTGQIYRFAREVVKKLQADALNIEDHDDKVAAMSAALRCESMPKLKAMVELCISELGVCINNTAFDSNPMLFNVQNGTIDLKTGKLHPHNALDYISKISPINFDPKGKCPITLKFLLQIMNDDISMVNYLRDLTGYCMTGNTMEKGFYIFNGITDTGKSTFAELILYLMGGYGGTAETSLILSNKYKTKSTNDLADLVGCRFVLMSETEDGAALDESRIKTITSGMDSIRCRQLYQENFEYKPTYKLILLTNSKPYIRGSDDAIWNRLHCVPFEVQIPKQEQDKQLVDKMKAESSGILNWMIEEESYFACFV